MRANLAMACVMTVSVSLYAPIEKVSARDFCGTEGSIGAIQFQPCNKIGFEVGRSRPKLDIEEFMLVSQAHTSVVIAQHNVGMTEFIAKALEQNHQNTKGAIAPTVLAYKSNDLSTPSLPTEFPPMWLAQK
ncbi:hypothetical protein V2H45_24870 [Tumidithrix elongata RA019]|uniref:Uncharacterized protein n=1 Tax=Tumidithrix elongata BACA0141 TaxID=2716417 RepID=A0AAW9Q712_9CYAN|nr:hypothetical protein [Tumidithrix elongata RA019]